MKPIAPLCLVHTQESPDGRCFHVARAVIKSVQSFSLAKLQRQTETKSADPEGYPLFSMLSQGLLTGKRPFQDGAMFALLQGTSSTSSEGQQSCS